MDMSEHKPENEMIMRKGAKRSSINFHIKRMAMDADLLMSDLWHARFFMYYIHQSYIVAIYVDITTGVDTKINWKVLRRKQDTN